MNRSDRKKTQERGATILSLSRLSRRYYTRTQQVSPDSHVRTLPVHLGVSSFVDVSFMGCETRCCSLLIATTVSSANGVMAFQISLNASSFTILYEISTKLRKGSIKLIEQIESCLNSRQMDTKYQHLNIQERFLIAREAATVNQIFTKNISQQ